LTASARGYLFTVSRELPRVLAPLQEERDRLDHIIDELGASADPTTRADLATELVRSCSRYEDVKDRCVYPTLEKAGIPAPTLSTIRRDEASIRDAMEVIRKRTAHMTPANVHADDPEGFDHTLEGLVDCLDSHLGREERDLFPLLEGLSADAAADLTDDVILALRHASERPKPSHNPVGRAIGNLGAALERTVEDASTPQHPGRDKLENADNT
jgi:hypothetical protein